MSTAQQMTLLPEINRSATEKKVKEALDLSCDFIRRGFHRFLNEK
ncbi:hypothetical protein [Brevibacillus parabrevis]|nr:hypothetical protein [Brevibacillus parabrevis]